MDSSHHCVVRKPTCFIPCLPTKFGVSLANQCSAASPRRPRSRVAEIRCAKANPNQVLSQDQLSEWSKISTVLQQIDPDLQTPQADKLVARAFGWGTQKFWRGDVKDEPPCLLQVENSIQFLRDMISLDDAGIATIIKSFPEVLRLQVDRMEKNLSTIQRTYPNIKGQLLVNTVKSTPAVLGYDYDCEGDCKSECARCWVQF